MAAAVKAQYSATYGSEAYDLDRVQGYALPDEEIYEEPSSQERIRQRLDERARERAKAKAQAEAASQIRLAQISGETSRVRASIAQLEERQEILEINYETTFNMEEIESYAVNILGMSRGLDEMYTGGVILADRAQILAEDETAGLGARIIGFLKSLPEYFS